MIETAHEGDKNQCYETLMPYRIIQSLIKETEKEKVVRKRKDKIETESSWREGGRS